MLCLGVSIFLGVWVTKSWIIIIIFLINSNLLFTEFWKYLWDTNLNCKTPHGKSGDDHVRHTTHNYNSMCSCQAIISILLVYQRKAIILILLAY